MSDLDRLFYWRGIAPDYHNYRGEHVHVPVENRTNLLKAMGVDVSTPEAIAREAYVLDVEPWQRWLRELSICPAGESAFFELNIAPEDECLRLDWFLLDQHGKMVQNGSVEPSTLEETGEYRFEGKRFSRRKVPVGALEPDYYRLAVRVNDRSEQATLAACPPESYQPSWVQTGERIWGVIIQLYTLRSARNWGIGDFTDLQALLSQLANCGADVVGLNPLHALSPYLEEYFSPYSPSDRRFLNPLYVDPERVAEWQDDLMPGAAELASLRDCAHVDYCAVRDLKYPVFEALFSRFIEVELVTDSIRGQRFKDFIVAESHSLLAFARYEAHHQRWQHARYILNEDIPLDTLATALALKSSSFTPEQFCVLFHCYLQWVADEQLEKCQGVARQAGMKLGLIRDLAVGADGGGAEVSTNNALFCCDSAIGAPPDPFAHTGQNWGLPPVIPSEMRGGGFRHFIGLLHSNMAHCGALRIDHAMSLMRLWWCPPGHTADYGAYVYYPFHETLGLLTLESYLNRCQIIAEDLGVVPDEFRHALAQKKIFTNKVFYFEKIFHDRFKYPRDYEPRALAMLNNHDLPTLVSWWNGSDLDLRNQLNLLEEGVDYVDICREREKDKRYLLELLRDEGLYPEEWRERTIDAPADEALVDAIMTLASRAASQIFVIQLEDLLLMDEAVNVPGTFKEHENWKRKISHSVEEIFTDPRVRRLLTHIDSERKNTK